MLEDWGLIVCVWCELSIHPSVKVCHQCDETLMERQFSKSQRFLSKILLKVLKFLMTVTSLFAKQGKGTWKEKTRKSSMRGGWGKLIWVISGSGDLSVPFPLGWSLVTARRGPAVLQQLFAFSVPNWGPWEQGTRLPKRSWPLNLLFFLLWSVFPTTHFGRSYPTALFELPKFLW